MDNQASGPYEGMRRSKMMRYLSKKIPLEFEVWRLIGITILVFIGSYTVLDWFYRLIGFIE